MAPIERVFIPWGEFKPDQKDFAHRDLVKCRNVVPVYGNYAVAPSWQASTATWDGASLATRALGLHTHPTSATAWMAYMGDVADLWELDPTAGFARTNVTRLVGGAYNPVTTEWRGISFGDSVVMTNYWDGPQIKLAGAARFENMITSTFQPRFRYVATLKNNLIGANCNLPLAYDTLSAGANPNLVCWSQNENIRAFGSQNVDPQLTGADIQPLLNDYGEITGMIGGEFVLIAQQRGWVRMEGSSGSSYSFRVISAGTGCRFSSSIGYFDGDVYFWGPSGPSRFRGGEGPVEVLGTGGLTRTLLDNTTGYSTDALLATIDPLHVGFMVDPVNRLVAWTVTSNSRSSTEVADVLVVYNVDEQRFSLVDVVTGTADTAAGLLFPTQHIATTAGWLPFRDSIGVLRDVGGGGAEDYIGTSAYGTGNAETRPIFATGFLQLSQDRTSRVMRVRPVYSVTTPSAARDLKVTVYVRSKNRSWEAATEAGPFTSLENADQHSYVTSPGARTADFHQIEVSYEGAGAQLYEAAEFKGIEIEFSLGGTYGA